MTVIALLSVAPVIEDSMAAEVAKAVDALEDFDVEYESVVVFGTIRVVTDTGRKRRALELLMEQFAPDLTPGEDYEPIADASIERTSVYRIDIEGWSGKRNDKPEDFPGAYDYDAPDGGT